MAALLVSIFAQEFLSGGLYRWGLINAFIRCTRFNCSYGVFHHYGSDLVVRSIFCNRSTLLCSAISVLFMYAFGLSIEQIPL